MTTHVGWKLDRHPSSAVTQYGQVYNGPTGYSGSDYGGYLSRASDEYATWKREHITPGGYPPDEPAIVAQQAMQQTPSGVFIEIDGSTCGSTQRCEGG